MSRRLIDANAFIKYFEVAKNIARLTSNELRHILCTLYDEVIKEIEKQPTIDAVEVVRCKTCQHQKTCEHSRRLGINGYCSDGERRSDGTKQ